MSSNPSIGSQPYTRPNYNYPQPGSFLYPNIPAFNPPSAPQMPRVYQPQPYIPPSTSYPGSLSRPTTSFPTSGAGQPTFTPHAGGSSGPSFRNSDFSVPSFRSPPTSFNPPSVTTGITPSRAISPSMPPRLSAPYVPTSSNAGFSPPSLQPLDSSFLRYPTSMAVIPPPSSFGGPSFSQPPSLSGRAYVSPVSSGPQWTEPFRNHEVTVWTPPSVSIDRSTFIPQTFGKVSGNSSLPQYQSRFSTFEKHMDSQKSILRQFEDTIKTMYQIHPSPERPFAASWQTMGMPVFAVQINPQTTLFVDPVAVTESYQRASAAQQRVFQAQFTQLMSRREAFDPNERRLSTMQQVNTFVLKAFNNPRVQGSLQVLGGVAEVSAGYGITWGTGFIAAPIGHVVIVHGLDHVTTGLYSVVTGKPKITATQLALQTAGIPSEIAAPTDAVMSITGMGMGAKMASQLVTYPKFQLMPPNLIANRGGWILPKEGGGAFINGRWYVEHALERMAPRTPQVMAELEARALQRASAKGLEPGTEAFSEWMRCNGPAPRGVPLSVVEAEIANTGSTNVRVILNQKGEVVTVITGGT